MSDKSDAGDSPNPKQNMRIPNKNIDNDNDDDSFTNSISFDDSSEHQSMDRNKRKGNRSSNSNSKPGSKQGRAAAAQQKEKGSDSKKNSNNALQKKAQTQKINLTKKEKDLHTPVISPVGNQAVDGDEQEKPVIEDDVKKSTKKLPKVSLKRQMTQRRMSSFSSQAIISPNSIPRKTMAAGDMSPFGGTGMSMKGSSKDLGNKVDLHGRNSLTNIKDKANKTHGRQSMMVTQIKGLNTPTATIANNKHKSLGGAIEEASENDSDEDETEQKNETIMEFENEDEDPFKQYENDELFKRVTNVADLITNPVHSEQDQIDILNYLKQLPCMEGRFDHLNKNLTKKLIDTFEVRFVAKGDYLFKQGDKPDYAYVILYGTVIYFKVVKNTYMVGQEPPSPTAASDAKTSTHQQIQQQLQQIATKNMSAEQLKKQQEEQREKEMFENKRNKIIKDNLVVIEEEIKMPFEQSVGIMIGEIAMMNPENTTRALSGMAKTDCIFLLLNREAFDILVKEKEKKENEQLTQFIFDSVPKMKEQFQFKKVVKTVKILFPTLKYIRGKEIIREGDRSEKLYIIKEGLCAMYKQVEVKDMLGMPKVKLEKIMNIEAGGIFGEEGLIFDTPNSYSIVAITPVVLLTISYADLKREFKRLLPGFAEFYQKRNEFIQERYHNIKHARNYERKHFKSKIEKGAMNVFLQKDFQNQIDFADKKTKRKLQVFFLRKELQQLQDAKQRLNDELEREKQELTNFHHTISHNNSNRWIPPMIETPQVQYVSKVLFPQRIMKQSIQNESILKQQQMKQTMNIDLKKSGLLLNTQKIINSQSTKSLMFPMHSTCHNTVSYNNNFAQEKQQLTYGQPFTIMSPQQQQHSQNFQTLQSLKNQRTLSHANILTVQQQQSNQKVQTNTLFMHSNQDRQQIQAGSIVENNNNNDYYKQEEEQRRFLRTTDNQTLQFNQSHRLKHLSSQQQAKHHKAPLKGRAVSTLASYNNIPSTTTASGGIPNSYVGSTPNNINISLKGSNIKSEQSQQFFFDKRVVAKQQQLQQEKIQQINQVQQTQQQN